MRKNFVLLLLILPFCLTGCWDGKDPEDRSYVITLGVDRTENGMLFTFAPAKTTQAEATVYAMEADTLTKAVAQADSHSSREVYLGQLKTVVFGKSLLEDADAFASIAEELLRGITVSEKVMVLATEQDAQSCVNAITEVDNSTGLFLWDFYKNTANEVAVTRAMDLDTMQTDLQIQKGSMILPRITATQKGLSLGGGIALHNAQYLFALSDDMEQYALLLSEEGTGAVIEGKYGEATIPFEIRKNKVHYDYALRDGSIVCDMSLQLFGGITGSNDKTMMEEKNRTEVQNLFANIIKINLENTIKTVQQKTDGDVFGLWARLQRECPNLYDDKKSWQDMEISMHCQVILEDTGRIR